MSSPEVTMIDAPVKSVTVYRDRARVTRRVKQLLAAGDQILKVPNLPTSLDSDSVRVSGRGENVVINSVDVKTEHATDVPEGYEGELQKRLKSIQDEQAKLTDEAAALESRLTYLQGLTSSGAAEYAKSLASGDAKLDDATAFGEYLERELTLVKGRQRALQPKIEEGQRNISAIEQRLNELRDPARMRHALEIFVTAAQGTPLELEVSYVVENAEWQPVYDARLEGDELELTVLANITNDTGEAWTDVDLSLSTAQPAASADLPELGAWYLGPKQRSQLASRTIGAEFHDPYMAKDDGDEMPKETFVREMRVESARDVILTYRVPDPVTIPTGGTPYLTTVTITTFEVKRDYMTAPRRSEAVYVRATMTNTSDFILLPGDVHLFHGDDFVGKTSLQTVVTGQEFQMQGGVDSQVVVKHELTARDVNKKRLRDIRQMSLTYTITVTNHRDKPIDLTVYDQIPIGKFETIKVKLEEATPQPDDQSDLNVLTWAVKLGAGESKTLRYTFSVEHPRTIVLDDLE